MFLRDVLGRCPAIYSQQRETAPPARATLQQNRRATPESKIDARHSPQETRAPMSRHRSSAACPSLPASRWVPFVAVAVFLTVWNRTINFAPTERVIVRSATAAAAGHPPPSSQAAPPLPPPYLAPAGSPPSQVTAPPSVAPWRLGRPVLVFSGGQEGDSSTLKPSSLSLYGAPQPTPVSGGAGVVWLALGRRSVLWRSGRAAQRLLRG